VQLQKAVLVGMPETPHGCSLPFVATEINETNSLLSQHLQTNIIEEPTKDKVLSALRDSQIAHFACHGYSSREDPSKSHLVLNDWQTSPLTVADLTTLNTHSSQFAYLSACHSAGSNDLSLSHESINLSSAVQLAGYSSVVGTLWQVSDQSSAEVATDVYAWMLRGDKLEPERAAEGLHLAIRSLRERTRTVPGFTRNCQDDALVWAPYIHLGV
jgi:CHAT domain-containing protein